MKEDVIVYEKFPDLKIDEPIVLIDKREKGFVVGELFGQPSNQIIRSLALGCFGNGEIAMSNNTNTVRLHRVLRAPSERVYRAFLDPDAMAKWSPPHGFTGKVHEMDAHVGGGYRMSFTNFGTGKTHSFYGRYTELTTHDRIRYTDKFDDPNLAGEMQVTISLHAVACGTEVEIVQERTPSAIPVELCYLGWQESLALLAYLVETDIPDNV